MSFTTIFFDLDETIYPAGNGLWNAIGERMTLYMTERLKIDPEQVDILRRSFFEKYGTTLRGLQHHYQVDALDFLAYVHDLPLSQYLAQDERLKAMLERLTQRKYIFTNADANHARRVLGVLDLEQYFEGIIDVVTLDYACKPSPAAYQAALAIAGESDPRRCIYLDDSPRNLQPATQLGFYTILVGAQSANPAAMLSIPSILDLPLAVPHLFPVEG